MEFVLEHGESPALLSTLMDQCVCVVHIKSSLLLHCAYLQRLITVIYDIHLAVSFQERLELLNCSTSSHLFRPGAAIAATSSCWQEV